MATIATAAAGNWGTAGTWTGGVLPGLGDTAQINHQVILEANHAVGGIDPASTGMILSTGAGSVNHLAVGALRICYSARGITIT